MGDPTVPDETSARAAFQKIVPLVRGQTWRGRIDLDLQQVGLQALTLQSLLAAPDLAALFAKAEEIGLLDTERRLRLADLARAAWWGGRAVERVRALRSDAKLPAALVSEATSLKQRMMEALGYRFAKDPEVVAKLAAIRAGTGYTDLAGDLGDLGDLYEDYPEVSRDDLNYRPTDLADARRIEQAMLDALSSTATPEDRQVAADARGIYLMLKADYDALRRFGELLVTVTLNDPSRAAAFASLYTRVRAAQTRPASASKATPQPTPAEGTT